MQLSHCRLPAFHENAQAVELVLIHGWGASSNIWQEWLPLVRQYCHVTLVDLPGYGDSAAVERIEVDELLPALLAEAPKQAVYLGYSLGGMLAVKVAEQYPERVLALVTFASNVRFVACEQWPLAMEETTYKGFYTLLKRDPKRALTRFAGLQASGASDEKRVLKTLRAKTANCSKDGLLASLQLLVELDNTDLLASSATPALHVFADNDCLVPAAAGQQIAAQSPASVEFLHNAPHSFFISQPRQSWQKVMAFLQRQAIIEPAGVVGESARRLDKLRVARSFSRAANSYDSVAQLQRKVGGQLITGLPDTRADVVLDLGCGTGFFTPQLQAMYPDSAVVGLDIAQGMVAFAAAQQRNHQWLCGDAERLPLADNSVDVVFSSLAIQWCEGADELFAEVFRVLKPGGMFAFSTLGPETLHELRKAWQAVDDYVHVNRFVGRPRLMEAMQVAGFIGDTLDPVLTEDLITLQYPSIKHLSRELKLLGAHNINNGRPSGLTGKVRMQQFIDAYERQRNSNNCLPASYQAWYGYLQKPSVMASITHCRQANGG